MLFFTYAKTLDKPFPKPQYGSFHTFSVRKSFSTENLTVPHGKPIYKHDQYCYSYNISKVCKILWWEWINNLLTKSDLAYLLVLQIRSHQGFQLQLWQLLTYITQFSIFPLNPKSKNCPNNFCQVPVLVLLSQQYQNPHFRMSL